CTCTPLVLPPSVNVDATQWTANFATSPAWNCSAAGTTTIDSTAGTVNSTRRTLGTVDVSPDVAQTHASGPHVMVVRLKSLSVTGGHVIKITGNKPVIFLVAGNVVVDSGGKIDAGATGTTAGAGGNIASVCTGSTGGTSVKGSNDGPGG